MMLRNITKLSHNVEHVYYIIGVVLFIFLVSIYFKIPITRFFDGI